MLLVWVPDNIAGVNCEVLLLLYIKHIFYTRILQVYKNSLNNIYIINFYWQPDFKHFEMIFRCVLHNFKPAWLGHGWDGRCVSRWAVERSRWHFWINYESKEHQLLAQTCLEAIRVVSLALRSISSLNLPNDAPYGPHCVNYIWLHVQINLLSYNTM